MKTRIVRIGNSQGIRIPKPILEQTGLSDEVELEVQDDAILIRSARVPREGWEEQFRRMAELGDDELLIPEGAADIEWDHTEWEW